MQMFIVFCAYVVASLLGIGVNSFPMKYKSSMRSNQKSILRSSEEGANFGEAPTQIQRSTEPSRHDICRMFLSGIVATEPKETYLANGHYVLNFQIATVGHFDVVHDWEMYKPTETMWLATEVWDDLAKEGVNNGIIRKGGKFSGMGTLIFNKWNDKSTGEERKLNKVRILEFMDKSSIESMGFDEGLEKKRKLSGSHQLESDMFQTSPEVESQFAAPMAKKLTKTAKRKLDNDFDDDYNENSKEPRIPF